MFAPARYVPEMGIDPTISPMAYSRIHQLHDELGDIVEDPGMAASLPQALLHRLKAMRGILLKEMTRNPEADSESGVDSA